MNNKVSLSEGTATRLASACRTFNEALHALSGDSLSRDRAGSNAKFRSASEMDSNYAKCSSQAIPTLLLDYQNQATAMATMFEIAGGTLSAQDDEAAAALKNAAAAPPAINGPSMAIPGLSAISALDNEASRTDKFSWVSGEDASGMSLDAMKTGAESLSPGDLRSTAEQFTVASQTLGAAADQLLADVQRELGSSWQGEFANAAQTNVALFHGSAHELAGQLTTVADRANVLADGYEYTRTKIGGITPDEGSGSDKDAGAAFEASRRDAQRVIHSEYNPRLESANLSELSFTPAHRVGNAGAAGITAVSPVALWNRDVPPPTGDMAAASGSGIDAHTALASSGGNIGGGASGGSVLSGGASAPAAGGAPSTANASAPGVAASGVIPSSVGGAAAGAVRQASGNVPSTGSGRSGTTVSSPATARNGIGGSRSVTGSSPGSVSRASSGTSSAPLSGRSGMAGGGAGAGSGVNGLSSSRGSSPFGAGSGGAATSTGGASGASGSAGAAPRAGIGTGTASANGAASAPSAAPGSAGTSRMGSPMMGAMPMAGGAKSGDKAHAPADYLVHPSHSSELIGNLPAAVRPVLRGSRAPEE